METDMTLLRRPNGRPQACDPCRARKVACDHGQPTCSRCSKRKQTCVYTVSESRINKRSRQRSRLRSVSQSSASASASSSSSLTPTPVSTGYLGFTSHNDVFQEARTSLSLVHGPGFGAVCHVGDAVRRLPKAKARLGELPPPLLKMALHALRNLPGPEFEFQDYRFMCRPDDWIILSIRRIIRSLHTLFAEHLTDRTDAQLEEMALAISNNTSKPFKDDRSCAESWTSQYAGPNIRWESLGLVWTLWIEINDRNLQTTRSCLAYCIELSRYFAEGNSLVLYLCYRRVVIDSLISGDASAACWISHGESVSMLTFLGLHAQSNPSSYRPSLSSENKRRLFAKAFNIDKVIVSFTGRPPLLSRRYCSTPLPLDIADSALIAGGQTLDRAIQELDHAGWSTTIENVLPATLIRARVLMAYLKDEILEFALGPSSRINLDDLRDIKARQEKTMFEFPNRLIYREGDLEDRGLSFEDLYARILVRLEHLQSLFFVERLMLRHGHPDDGRLLTISFEMVTLTQVFWTHQDRFMSIRRDLEWLLMAYAAPGGGILCLELLRPTFHGTHPDCPRLSRSTIIQTLSLLIGFLDWVRPSAPNADLCSDCKTIIQGVLDHNLNAPAGGTGALDTLDWEFPMQLDFNFDLLDTFGWLRPE